MVAHDEFLTKTLSNSIKYIERKCSLEKLIYQANKIKYEDGGVHWCSVPNRAHQQLESLYTVVVEQSAMETRSPELVERHLYHNMSRMASYEHMYSSVYTDWSLQRMLPDVCFIGDVGFVNSVHFASAGLYKCTTTDNKTNVSSDKTDNLQLSKLPECKDNKCDNLLSSRWNSSVVRSINMRSTDKFEKYYVAGDNVDITITPTYMTSTKQRKSLHWFISLAVNKRVVNNSLPNDGQQSDIRLLSSSVWLPTSSELTNMTSNFKHHILQVIMKLNFIKKLDCNIPQFISHPYIDLTQKKSKFHVTHLIDANENKGEGMIRILTELHDAYVPRENKDHPNVLDRVDFAGDVLTAERAFSAQCAMSNGFGSHEALSGMNYRSGGLHLVMNLCVV
jgi:hypothetical protein